MSFFFGDGFDLYAATADMVAGYWDVAGSNPNSSSLVAGRFSGSKALSIGGNPGFIKTSNVNDAVHHITFAYMSNVTSTSLNLGFYTTFWDGATAQCSVAVRGDGAIQLISGAMGGTVLATWNTGAALAANVWYAFEIEVVINNTTGSITLRKNGNPSNDFTLGSLNTRTTANNYANKISVGFYNSIGGSVYIDDYLWRSDVASVLWSGDVRCYTRRPTSDVQAQFSRTSAPAAVGWSGVGVGQSFAANTAVYMQFTAPSSGLLTGVIVGARVADGGGVGHMKVALFSVLNNLVGTVLATSAELTNPPAGTGYTFTFPSPYYVTAGQRYFIGVINDSGTCPVNVTSGPDPTYWVSTYYLSSPTYGSWPVSNPTGTQGGGNSIGMTFLTTPQANADAVSEMFQDATASYVYSSTVGQNDLYSIGGIGAVPASIIGVTTRGYFEKSDSGSRNATVQMKSGGVTVQGADTALNTVWGWVYRSDTIDPATGSPWTVSGVNSLNIGPKVTA